MSSVPQDRKLRVVQWAPGDTGTRALRTIIEHPKMELVGLFAYSESKLGKDAGKLVGLPPVGVKATHDIDAIIATRADCVLYTPRALINVFNSFSVIADAVNLPMEDFNVKVEAAATRSRLPIACGVLEAGTVAGLRISTTGLRKGVPLFLMRTHWFCGNDLDADWELRGDGWRLQVMGDAPLDIGITLPIPESMHHQVTPGYTAHPAVNAIPAVVAAPPGIITSVDLPHIVADLGER